LDQEDSALLAQLASSRHPVRPAQLYCTSTQGRNDFASGSNVSQASARAWENNSASPGLSSRRRILGASADGEPGVGGVLFARVLLIFTCWKEAPGIRKRTQWPARFFVTG